jgi:hypothetical protein
MRSVLDGQVAVLSCCIDVRPLTFQRQPVASSVGVQLELLALIAGPVTIPLSWDFTAGWFVSFGSLDQR